METIKERQARLREERKAEREALLDRSAAAYGELFASDLGREVLRDLCKRFPPEGRRFRKGQSGNVDPWMSAVRDGEGGVTSFIRQQIERAGINENRKTET